MPFTPKQLREYRKKLQDLGICTRCHKVKAGKGRKICIECSKKTTATKKEMRKDNTRCHACLNRIDEYSLIVGHIHCPSCLEKMVESKQRRKHAKANKTIKV